MKISWRKLKAIVNLPKSLLVLIISSASFKGIRFYFSSFSALSSVNGGKIILEGKLWIDDNSKVLSDSGLITISENVFINRNCIIVSMNEIEIGANVLIADGVSIYDHDHIIANSDIAYGQQGFISKKITVCNNVWIGSHSVILKGVTLGDGCVVAAGSVVTSSIPSRQIWGGVPAKFIKLIE
jgi:acetyltransferase-like isoleucine patch superfamily enzyme